ncbi:hypothetical protein [Erythrobacter sp. AP23]|uniref:hypothetical protein n=1 Tax=Erythrobacter sp. AP23 TaxID=499656 RepID=UPI00076DEB43|nr:hypothetical protein [Erythrobacter sp. AP23]KWV94440.1 hypothetical protein ASS64_11635 [Erythrobacter sp. AP23]
MWTAIISAAAAIIIAALTHLFNKSREREATWRAKKLEYYEAFFRACSGISGGADPPNDAKIAFANTMNDLHLIASQDVIDVLHELQEIVAESNAHKFSVERHDEIWSRLVWYIREDLGDAPQKPIGKFKARLWASGTGANVQPPR